MGNSNKSQKSPDIDLNNREYAQELLIFGYIADISKVLDKDVLVPKPIILLCLKFYSVNKIMYYLSQPRDKQKSAEIYCSTIDHSEHWKADIQNLIPNTYPDIMSDDSGVFVKKNFVLPQQLSQDISKLYKKYFHGDYIFNDKFDCVFVCGGFKAKQCSVIAFDNQQFYDYFGDYCNLKGIHFTLPNIPVKSNDVCMSDKYGLISVGQETKNVYALDFESLTWKTLKAMHKKRSWVSSICIKTDINRSKEKLIAVGGYNDVCKCTSYFFFFFVFGIIYNQPQSIRNGMIQHWRFLILKRKNGNLPKLK